jgi:hypothetical protein
MGLTLLHVKVIEWHSHSFWAKTVKEAPQCLYLFRFPNTTDFTLLKFSSRLCQV